MGRLIALGVAFLTVFVLLFYGGVFVGQNSEGLNLGDYASITLVGLILFGAFFGGGTIILALVWPHLSSFHDDEDIVDLMERNDMVEDRSYDKGYDDGYQDGIIDTETIHSGSAIVRSVKTYDIDEEPPTTVTPGVIYAPAPA